MEKELEKPLGGKTIMVAGEGIIGEAIVESLLAAGAIVVAPSASEKVLCRLRERLPDHHRLYTPLCEIMTLHGARELLDWLKVELGGLDAVISGYPGFQEKIPLLGTSLDTWQKQLARNLTAQFIIAKIYLPMLSRRTGGAFLFVETSCGKEVTPWSGPGSVAAAGGIMLKDMLHTEARDNQVRINSLLITPPGPEGRRKTPDPGAPTARDIARYCAFLVGNEAGEIRGATILFTDINQLPDSA